MTKLLLKPTDEYILMNGMYFRIFTGRFYGRAMYFPILGLLSPPEADPRTQTPEFLKHIAYEFPPNKIHSLLPVGKEEIKRGKKVVNVKGYKNTNSKNKSIPLNSSRVGSRTKTPTVLNKRQTPTIITGLLLEFTDQYVLLNGIYFRIFSGMFCGASMYFPIPTILPPKGQDPRDLTPAFLQHVANEFPPNKIYSLLPAKRNQRERYKDKIIGTMEMGTTAVNLN